MKPVSNAELSRDLAAFAVSIKQGVQLDYKKLEEVLILAAKRLDEPPKIG